MKHMENTNVNEGTIKREFDLKEKHAKKYVAYLRKRYGKKRAKLFSDNAS